MKCFRPVLLCLSYLAARSCKVWVDTDNAAGLGGVRDVDDALALIQLLNSAECEVLGISTVFGNARLENVTEATERLLTQFYSERKLKVYPGASGPNRDIQTPAVDAMVDAMHVASNEETVIDVLALGPLTNVATLIQHHPELVPQLRVVFVGGRRPGQLFRIGTHNLETLADLNFEKDTAAASSVLLSGVKLILVPFQVSSQVKLRQSNLDQFRSCGTATASWIADVSTPWLEFWKQTWSVDYFNPFDCLAVLQLTHPTQLGCSQLWGGIESARSDNVNMLTGNRLEGDPSVHGFGRETKLYLHVANVEEIPCGSRVEYCHKVQPETTKTILERLMTPTSALERIEL